MRGFGMHGYERDRRFGHHRMAKPLIIGVVLIAILGLLVMSLWNALLPAILGVKSIGFWQALGLWRCRVFCLAVWACVPVCSGCGAGCTNAG